MRFLDLGDLRIEVDGEQLSPGGRRPAQVLSTLLMHLNRRVSIDLLVDGVWGDQPGPRAAATLETHVWRLRRLVEPERPRGAAASVLLNDAAGYRLVASPDSVDSARFEHLCLDVVDLLNSEQPERALRAADEARSLWRGRPFEVIAGRPWAAGPIARLDELHVQLDERRIDAMLAMDDAARAVVEVEPLLAAHPFRERLWWQRMLALYRTGRSEEALQAYRSARQMFRDELGLEPGRDLADLQGRILVQDPALESTGRAGRARPVEVRLPRARTLIARDADQRWIVEALVEAPLVTITGPAGCGKTRLSIEAARSAAAEFPDGVWFVDLSAAETYAEVEGVVIATLGLVVGPGNTAATALAAYGRDRRALLVLDNCEQALDAVGTLCEHLLGDEHQLAVLATCREPIGLPDEVVRPLAPLAIALPDGSPGPAVTLFVERAQLAGEDLSRPDVELIQRICRAAGGLPLAVELAAALASTYGLSEIADLVESDPVALTAIGRGHARHHQSLAGAITRSSRLLSEPEQLLFRRLAVIPAGFGRDLAAALVEPEIEASAVPALLARLVHRSLLGSCARPTRTPGSRCSFRFGLMPQVCLPSRAKPTSARIAGTNGSAAWSTVGRAWAAPRNATGTTGSPRTCRPCARRCSAGC